MIDEKLRQKTTAYATVEVETQRADRHRASAASLLNRALNGQTSPSEPTGALAGLASTYAEIAEEAAHGANEAPRVLAELDDAGLLHEARKAAGQAHEYAKAARQASDELASLAARRAS